MQDKKYIIVAIAGLIIALVAIVLVFLIGDSGSQEQPADLVNPFGDTSATRTLDELEAENLFNQFGGNWVDGGVQTGSGDKPAPRFRMLTKEESIGALIVTQGTESYVRYVDRRTGNMFETPLRTVSEPTPLSMQTVLRIGEVLWAPDGESVLLRTLDEREQTIFTFLGTFEEPRIPEDNDEVLPQGSQELVLRPLADDILQAALSPDNRSIFYLVSDGADGTIGYLESIGSGTKVEVWSSPLRNLTFSWTAVDDIVIYTNPSAEAIGVIWILDPDTWKSRVVLGNSYSLAGKTDLSGNRLLYSLQESRDGLYALRSLDMRTAKITFLPLPTIAEKCVWSKHAETMIYCAVPQGLQDKAFADHWYQGLRATNDVLWAFDTDTGRATNIFTPSDHTKTEFDIVDLAVDESGDYLVFRNKRDDMLWALELPNE